LLNLGYCERLNETNPIFNRNPDKFSKVGIEDVLESSYNALKRRLFISLSISFKEVMVLSELVLDFTYKIVSPLYEHVLRY
jgi:hypothetical protein